MRIRFLILFAVAVIVLPVSYGRAANLSSPPDQQVFYSPSVPAQPVSANPVRQTGNSITSMPPLLPSAVFTAYLPVDMGNYCLPFTISDSYFSASQFDMRQINADDAWYQCVQGDPSSSWRSLIPASARAIPTSRPI